MKNKSWLLAGALALAAVLAGTARGDEVVWLSSLDLSKARQGWGKPQADKSVDGHPMKIKGETFSHGFGTHSPGFLAIDLPNAGAKEFSAQVGIDDEVSAGKGSAEFEVVDSKGKILWRSGILHGGEAAKPVRLDLTGLSQIALRVTTGGDGFTFDHADWADAKFIISGAKPQTLFWVSPDPIIALQPEPAKPAIHAPAIIGVRPGTPLIWTVPVSGERPLKFSVRGLPAGLKMDPATGRITGTLSQTGDYRFRVQVSNAAGHSARTLHVVAGDAVALTPPLGWNSYDCFGDNVLESEVLANARYMAEKLQPVGWDTVVVDYCWYDPGAHDNNRSTRGGAPLTMDANGRLAPSPERFPSATNGAGFKPLADAVHDMGLKFGIHIMRGIPRNAVKENLPIEGSSFKAADAANTNDPCVWCLDMFGVRGATPAGQAYYDSIFRLYAAWGVDYVKMDDTSSPYHTNEIEAVRKAIDRCGRSIVFSLSPGETPVEQGAHVAQHANLWRVSGDFWDEWNPLDHEFTLATKWRDFVGPSHWPDADMLPVGHLSVGHRSVGNDRPTRFTRNEQVSLITLWSLLPSPLMVGANLPDTDAWTLALLTNPEVLAVNQDAKGLAASCVFHDEDVEVWTKKLEDGTIAVGLFNRDDLAHSLTLDWNKLGLKGRQSVRDLWQRQDLGKLDNYSTSVPAHGAVMIQIKPVSNFKLN